MRRRKLQTELNFLQWNHLLPKWAALTYGESSVNIDWYRYESVHLS